MQTMQSIPTNPFPRRTNKPVLIAVCGGTASGKTTFCEVISSYFYNNTFFVIIKEKSKISC